MMILREAGSRGLYDPRMGPAARLARWVETLNPVVKDGVLAAVLAATLLIDLAAQELPSNSPMRPADPLGYVLVALMILPLAVRRLYPVGVYVAVLTATGLVALLFYRPTSFGFGLIVATYTVARWCDRRSSLATLGVGLIFGVLIKARAIAAGLPIGLFEWPLDAIYFGAAWYLGDSIRVRRQYADELERNRQELARRAVTEERIRIAQELHDAIGHAVSVMVLQAGGGEESIGLDTDRVRGAFQSIAGVGRGALADMDRLIGLLRDSDLAPAVTQPKLDNITSLLDGYRDLGLEIHASIEHQPPGVPQEVGASIYRILEEALTNTLKHAGPTRAEVSLAYGEREVLLRIRDHGGSLASKPLGREPHVGRGLIGMQERANLFGGEVIASPHPGGGFIVVATLPYEETVG